MNQKKPTPKKPASRPLSQGLVLAAHAKKQRADFDAAVEDEVISSENWQWRKFALGMMNGLANYKAYAEAYSMPNVDRDERAYMVAAACSSKLLKNTKFRDYWRELIEEQGFNHDVVDTEALKLITDSDTPPQVRRAAIRDYNELRGRIVKKSTLTDSKGTSLFDDAAGFELKVVRSSSTGGA
jgi:hypothetical protein